MREQAQAALRKIESTPHSKQTLRLWLRLLTTTRLIEKQIRTRFREQFKTTLPRFDIMAALDRMPDGQTMGELSHWLMVSNGNVTGLAQRLADDGLATRTRLSQDKRTQIVKLSNKGVQEFGELSAAHEYWIEELFGGLTDEEMETLQSLLRKVKETLAAGPPGTTS